MTELRRLRLVPAELQGPTGDTPPCGARARRVAHDPLQSGPRPGAARAGSHPPSRYAQRMITFLIRALIFVVSAGVGLIVADLVLEGFTIDWSHWWGFILAVVIFAVLQSVLAPWLFKVARKNAPALLGGIGIVSTFAALVITALIPGAGLSIGLPWWTWVVAPLIVWLVTALAALFLPGLLLKKKVD